LVTIESRIKSKGAVFKKIMSQAAFGGGGGTGDVRRGKGSGILSYEEAEAETIVAKQIEADRKIVEEFLRRIPVTERLASVNSELTWYLTQAANPAPHEKCLPDYCYNIFEKLKRTLYKALPNFSDIITPTGDSKALAACKTIEDVKPVVRIDWTRMGAVIGMGIRGKRFVEMEAENKLKREGVWGVAPKNGASDLALVFDRSRLEKMSKAGGIQDVGRGLEQILKDDTTKFIEKLPGLIEYFGQLAYLWGSGALADFNKGVAAGLNGFLDEDGEPVGESVRANIYWFLLLAWPEIKEMLESKPRKTMADLHKWMLPFMRDGMCSLINVETLRDVCGPMRYGGIGLALRPLSSRSARPSD
jgi:hypothetical protein